MTPFIGWLLMKVGVNDGNIDNNNSLCMITGTNIANDHGDDGDVDEDNLYSL